MTGAAPTRIPDAIASRKMPRQARSIATVDCILQAATRILASESLAELSTNRVAEVAGVSIGSLYQYFPNKDALVAALIARAQGEVAASVEALAVSLDGESADPIIGTLLRASELRILNALTGLIERNRSVFARDLPISAARDCFLIAKTLVESDLPAAAPAFDLEARIYRALWGYLTVTSMRNVRDAPESSAITPGLSRKSPA